MLRVKLGLAAAAAKVKADPLPDIEGRDEDASKAIAERPTLFYERRAQHPGDVAVHIRIAAGTETALAEQSDHAYRPS